MPAEPRSQVTGARALWALLAGERRSVLLAVLMLLLNATLTLLLPGLLAHGIDRFVAQGDFGGVLRMGGLMLLALGGSVLAAYQQILIMGSAGQRVLYGLRAQIFDHLQQLPLAFFEAHKAGDLMARVNSDTEKLHEFLSETLVRLLGSLVIMVGSAAVMLSLAPSLGAVALLPVVLILILTGLFSAGLRRVNLAQLKQSGQLSAHLQESLSHFAVLAAFNRRDYFRQRFALVNQAAYLAARQAGLANQLLTPIFDFVFQLARLGVLAYGLWLLSEGELGPGLLIAYFAYLNRFYEPLRQLAALWASLQAALASWERIHAILKTPPFPNPLSVPAEPLASLARSAEAAEPEQLPVLVFDNVSFAYASEQPVLRKVNLCLEAGKSYALVGPTGGGKSTTAALMARLYDPDQGCILLKGQDLRTLSALERSRAIGFILQEPFLFRGTLYENLIYGHPQAEHFSPQLLLDCLAEKQLAGFLNRFEQGLETPVRSGNQGLSLGQQQLLAFVRAVLREPQLLILDEATANIDTVTEQWLQTALARLPAHTTRVLIAHRLNTIAQADQIFFVNAGELIPAGNLETAVNWLQTRVRQS